MNAEIWRPVAGWEGCYSVSNLGRVRSEERMVRGPKGFPKRVRGRILALSPSNGGYLYVTFSRDGETITIQVHLLVLEAFGGPCPDGMQCRHFDGIKSNLRLDNLLWGTPKENGQDRIRHGTQARGETSGAARARQRRAEAAQQSTH